MAAIDRLKKITFELAGNGDTREVKLPDGYVLNVKQVKCTYRNFASWIPTNNIEVNVRFDQILKSGVYPDNTDKSHICQFGLAIANLGMIVQSILLPDATQYWTPPAAYNVEGRIIAGTLSDVGSGTTPDIRVDFYGILVKIDPIELIRIARELRTV